jgi:cell division protein FtsW
LGVVRNGAARWLPFGQPSEFAKLALAIYLADYCARNLPRMGERWVGFLAPASLAAAMALLVFKEPDWGTAALIGAVAVLLLTQAGANLGYVCAALLIGGEVVALLLLQNQRHLDRVLAYLHPAQYRHSIGWQAWNAILALASGGVRGAYFGQGNQSQGFVPESQTDFVLSRIGEEWGLVGGETIVAAFVCLLLGGAWIAWQTKDPFAHFLASGLTFLIALQAFIHIGVVSGALPCKGIPLPFVSYGGSNLVCMLTSIGLLVSIARYAPATQQAPPRPPPPPMPGPIGTLLESSVQPLPGGLAGLGRGLRRAWRNHRFPSLPRYSYQLPPRPLAPAPRGRGPG